jgi:hypothetical protein
VTQENVPASALRLPLIVEMEAPVRDEHWGSGLKYAHQEMTHGCDQ